MYASAPKVGLILHRSMEKKREKLLKAGLYYSIYTAGTVPKACEKN
jgi:hypothetical protein